MKSKKKLKRSQSCKVIPSFLGHNKLLSSSSVSSSISCLFHKMSPFPRVGNDDAVSLDSPKLSCKKGKKKKILTFTNFSN